MMQGESGLRRIVRRLCGRDNRGNSPAGTPRARHARQATSRATCGAEALEPRRLFDAGDFDPSFDEDGVANFVINTIQTVQTTDVVVDERDGSAVIVGTSNTPGQDRDFVLLRVDPEGNLDPNFGLAGIVIADVSLGSNDFATSVTLDAQGRILVAGYTEYTDPDTGEVVHQDIALARFLPDTGAFDQSFGLIDQFGTRNGINRVDLSTQPGVFSSEKANAVIVEPNGSIIVGGATNTFDTNNDGRVENDFTLVRFTPDGQFDTNFGFGGALVTDFQRGASEEVFALALQEDGRILAGGNTAFFSPDTGLPEVRFGIARYLPDGTLDDTFGDVDDSGLSRTGTTINTFRDELNFGELDSISAIAVQPDGRIVVGGLAVTVDFAAGTIDSDFGIGRFTVDGDPDTSFAGTASTVTNLGGIEGITDLAIDPSGGIIAGGATFDLTSQTGGVAVVRYTTGGAVDPNFGDNGRLIFTSSFQPTQAAATAPQALNAFLPQPFALRPDGAGPFDLTGITPQADGQDALNQFQQSTQGLVAVTPRGRILIVASQGNSVNVAAVLGSGPPVAGIIVADLTQAGVNAIEIQVRYADDVLVSFATIDAADVVVVTPGGASRLVSLVRVDGGTSNQPSLTGVYSLSAPNGTFTAADNGTYTVNLQANQVSDSSGTFAPAGPLGTFSVQVGGTEPPPPADGPDLVAGAVSGNFPPAVVGGAKAKVSGLVLVTNGGNEDAKGTFTIRVLASTDGAAGPGDVTVATLPNQKVKLAPGQSKSYKLKFSAFPPAPDGDYFLLAQVDAPSFTETNQGNNVGATAARINIAAPFVDLSGTLGPPAGALRGGGKGTVPVLIRNTGNTVASGTATVGLFLSADRNMDGSDVALTGVKPAKLKLSPGASKPLKLSGVLPPAPGSYFLIAVLDAGNAIPEKNETDNIIVSDGQVTVA